MPTESKAEFKYTQWADLLRLQIKRGELAPGDRLPSHAAMKEQYGLSRPTVERAHLLLESEGLIQREERRGAFVAERKDTSHFIGVFSPLGDRYEHHPYNVQLLSGVREVTEQSGQCILLLGSTVLGMPTSLKWSQMGGVLVLATDDKQMTSLLDMLPLGMPCVTLIGDSPRTLSMTVDDYHGGLMATKHLLDFGHQRIASQYSQNSLVSRRRAEGYHQALFDAGIAHDARYQRDVDGHSITEHGFVQAAKNMMAQWLREDWDELGCTAILALNDECAIGFIEAFQEAGRRVPEDVSVVGFDGTELARHFRPHLTTVEVPLREIGKRGAQWLNAQMKVAREGGNMLEVLIPETRTLMPRLRVRATTSKVARQ